MASCSGTSTGDAAARLLEARSTIDVTSLLGEVQAPTLVIHSRDDEVCPISESRLLASGIPGAQFVELDSRNHILLEDEPAWKRFQEAVLDFAGLAPSEVALLKRLLGQLQTAAGELAGETPPAPNLA